jgi:hypothetical protein
MCYHHHEQADLRHEKHNDHLEDVIFRHCIRMRARMAACSSAMACASTTASTHAWLREHGGQLERDFQH